MNTKEWMDEMKNHKCGQKSFTPCDGVLTVGYVCACGHEATIDTWDLKPLELGEERGKVLAMALKTEAGRISLGRSMSQE